MIDFETYYYDDELCDIDIFDNFETIYIKKIKNHFYFLIKYDDGWILPLDIIIKKTYNYWNPSTYKFEFKDYKIINIDNYKKLSRSEKKAIFRGKFKVNDINLKKIKLNNCTIKY